MSEQELELINKYKNLNVEQKKYIIFRLGLEEKNDFCEDLINKIFEEEPTKYYKQLLLSSAIRDSYDRNEKIENYLSKITVNYSRILEKFSRLVKELKLQNSLEISILFTYLMWNGYFSKNNEFRYQTEKRANITNHFGLDIINGSAVCLNFSDMLKDVLKECGYSSSIMLNLVEDPKKMKPDYIPNIERKATKSKLIHNILVKSLMPLIKKTGNHAFNLIEENGKLYIYDSTNLIYIELESIYKGHILCGDGIFGLKPNLSYIVNDSNSRRALDILHSTSDFSSPYSKNDYIFTSENCMELFQHNKPLFTDYHTDINNDIEKIANVVDYYKQNKKIIKKGY